MGDQFRAQHVFARLINGYTFDRVLDIGAGGGEAAAAFRDRGKVVTMIDKCPASDDVKRVDIEREGCPYTAEGVIWCAHTLEHVHNVGAFLGAICRAAAPGVVVAITVPPLKHHIVGGHVNLFNAGILLYRMILAGFDCRSARIRQEGYNIGLIVEAPGDDEYRELMQTVQTGLVHDYGDIETLAKWWPEGLECRHGFDGDIKSWNWGGE